MLRRTIFAVLNLTLTDAELRVWHFAAFTMFTFVCIGMNLCPLPASLLRTHLLLPRCACVQRCTTG
jgi:hypothetical protein